MEGSFIDSLRRMDQSRRSFPGEHWLALAAGLWFLRRPGGSTLARLASKAVGAALLYRAASGRDGLQRLWRGGAGRSSGSVRSGREQITAAQELESEMASRTARIGGYPDFR